MSGDNMILNDGESLEPLGGGISVIVSQEHRFSTDTVLLANFANPKKHESVLEFGAGCGAISLIWQREEPPKKAVAVEIQQTATEMMKRSVSLNGLDDRLTVINGDLRELKGVIEAGSIDMIAMNPPYKIGGGGIVNESVGKRVARHETECTTDDITQAAAWLLRFGGRLCMCQRPERLTDVLLSMRAAGIEPKILRFVQQRTRKPPKLFLVEGKRGGRSGGLVMLPALMIENDSGGFSDEMISIYGQYKEGHL